MDPYIHSTAVVEDDVTIGHGTSVWHHAHVRRGAVIGNGCTLGKNVFVDAGVRIGNGVKIQNNVSVYAGVTIEDDVFVGPSAVFTNDLHPRAFAVEWSITPTVVRRGASIGANATIVCGIEIGELALVGSGAVVTRSVAAHRLVLGNPGRPTGWVCTCGCTVRTADGSEPSPDVICAACSLPWRRSLPHRGDDA
jgi:UDP-2-acetamido-3-amino-2,3-dideoxy-glucuronate N-acetyltransferase